MVLAETRSYRVGPDFFAQLATVAVKYKRLIRPPIFSGSEN